MQYDIFESHFYSFSSDSALQRYLPPISIPIFLALCDMKLGYTSVGVSVMQKNPNNDQVVKEEFAMKRNR